MNEKKQDTLVGITTLAAPSVTEADDNNHVEATVTYVTVVVPVWSGMASGDRVDLLWNGDVTGEYTDYLPVTNTMVSGSISPTFDVPSSEIATNHEAAISYTVTPAGGSDVESSAVYTLSIGEVALLPAPTVDEADGTTISVDDNPEGVTVTVPADADLEAGDVVTVYWTGTDETGTTTLTETVSGNGAGKALMFHIDANVLDADAGSSVQIYYTVTSSSGSEGSSVVAVYDISGESPAPGQGKLKVMGARSQRKGGVHGIISPLRTLTALDAEALTLLEASWQYEGDDDSVTGSRFRDTEPDRLLHVRTSDDHLTLNASNINGNYYSMVALRDVGNVVAWGDSRYGGEVPATIESMTDIVEIATTETAVAARRGNGTVVAWGKSSDGGSVPSDIATMADIIGVYSSGEAFVALRDNGTVVAWGNSSHGGTVPSDIATMTDIIGVYGSGEAFAALRGNGTVVAWGDSSHGGTVPSDIATITDIIDLQANEYAFAARRGNGTVVAWGHSSYGGTVPDSIAILTNIEEVAYTNAAFAARCTDGSVVAWGDGSTGEVPSTVETLNDIVSITGNHEAFVCLRSNGHVVAWGAGNSGGEVSATIATLDDIVQVTTTGGQVSDHNYGAFSALRSNGRVVAWGDAPSGGTISDNTASQLTDVQAVYCANFAFAALTADLRVVVWGKSSSGGDSSSVQEFLDGYVSYEATAAS